jgi:hypothetical protein
MRKIRMIYIIGLSTVIPTIILFTVITTVSVPLMWRNRDKRWPIWLPGVWSSSHFPFVITTPTFGNNWKFYCYRQWRRWYRQVVQSPKSSWGAIDIHYSYVAAAPLSRLYRQKPLLFRLPPVHLWPLPHECSSPSRIRLPKPLKLVTLILVGDNVTNNCFSSFLLLQHVTALCFSFHLS